MGDILGIALWVTYTGDPSLTGMGGVIQEDREDDASLGRWITAVEGSAAFTSVAGRTPRSFGFALDAVG